jgi:hypothetical protein
MWMFGTTIHPASAIWISYLQISHKNEIIILVEHFLLRAVRKSFGRSDVKDKILALNRKDSTVAGSSHLATLWLGPTSTRLIMYRMFLEQQIIIYVSKNSKYHKRSLFLPQKPAKRPLSASVYMIRYIFLTCVSLSSPRPRICDPKSLRPYELRAVVRTQPRV